MSFNIAIDGPAGAGKTTVAKKLAKKLGYVYVDTGAMFRAMGLYLIRNNVSLSDTDKICTICDEVEISIQYENGEQAVYLNRENVNSLIRTEEVGNMASACGTNPDIRKKLLKLQQSLAAQNDVIMEGRDITTSVLPHAQVKVYLTADYKERAARRYRELKQKGVSCNLDDIEKDILERDHRDTTREISPLVVAEDAIMIDSTAMTVDEVMDMIIKLVNR